MLQPRRQHLSDPLRLVVRESPSRTSRDRAEDSTDLADAFGLRNGDIIRRVGGIGLVDEGTAMAATQERLTGKRTKLEMARSGKSRSLLVYPMK